MLAKVVLTCWQVYSSEGKTHKPPHSIFLQACPCKHKHFFISNDIVQFSLLLHFVCNVLFISPGIQTQMCIYTSTIITSYWSLKYSCRFVIDLDLVSTCPNSSKLVQTCLKIPTNLLRSQIKFNKFNKSNIYEWQQLETAIINGQLIVMVSKNRSYHHSLMRSCIVIY